MRFSARRPDRRRFQVAAGKPLTDHLTDYENYLKARGRNSRCRVGPARPHDPGRERRKGYGHRAFGYVRGCSANPQRAYVPLRRDGSRTTDDSSDPGKAKTLDRAERFAR